MGLKHRQVLWVLSGGLVVPRRIDAVDVYHCLRPGIVGYQIPVCFLAFVGSGLFKATFVVGFHAAKCVSRLGQRLALVVVSP